MKKYIIGQIIIIIIILIIVIIYYFKSPSIPENIEKYKKIIDSTQCSIDSLKIELKESDRLIESMGGELINLKNQNDLLKEDIKSIKQNAKNKVDMVDKFSNTELQHFFTDRYK